MSQYLPEFPLEWPKITPGTSPQYSAERSAPPKVGWKPEASLLLHSTLWKNNRQESEVLEVERWKEEELGSRWREVARLI